VPVGYSGHETGFAFERGGAGLWGPASLSGISPWTGRCGVRITLRRSSPTESRAWYADIRLIEKSMGDGVKRVLEREQPIINKLRRVRAAHA